RFGTAARIAAFPDFGGAPGAALAARAALAADTGLPLMAVGEVLAHDAARRPLQDVLTAIRHHVTLDAAGFRLAANAERRLKPPAEMARLFRSCPDAIAETLRFAGELRFSLDELRHQYPDEDLFGGLPAQDALARLARDGLATRYPAGIPH